MAELLQIGFMNLTGTEETENLSHVTLKEEGELRHVSSITRVDIFFKPCRLHPGTPWGRRLTGDVVLSSYKVPLGVSVFGK